MVNNFSWNLDIISHSDQKKETTKDTKESKDKKDSKDKKESSATGKAHYSDNWTKEDQDKYNAEYYQTHKWKWGVNGDYKSFMKEHGGSTGKTESIGTKGNYYVETAKDGTKALMREDQVLAAGSDIKTLDTKAIGDYVDKAYTQDEEYQKKMRYKTGSSQQASHNKEFGKLTDEQVKTLVEKGVGSSTGSSSSSKTTKEDEKSKKKKGRSSSGSSSKGSGSSKKSSSSSSKSSGISSANTYKKSTDKIGTGTLNPDKKSTSSGGSTYKYPTGSKNKDKKDSNDTSTNTTTQQSTQTPVSTSSAPSAPQIKDASQHTVDQMVNQMISKGTLKLSTLTDDSFKSGSKVIDEVLDFLKTNNLKADESMIKQDLKQKKEKFDRMTIKHSDFGPQNNYSWNLDTISHSDDKEFGIPEQKKFPLDTRAHVISAIKFFNYADPVYRKELASAIVRKIHEYNITGLTPSDDNAFYKYYTPDDHLEHDMNNYSWNLDDDFISHHGVLGMKWGVRRYQNADGSLTAAGRKHNRLDGETKKKLIKESKEAYKSAGGSKGIKKNVKETLNREDVKSELKNARDTLKEESKRKNSLTSQSLKASKNAMRQFGDYFDLSYRMSTKQRKDPMTVSKFKYANGEFTSDRFNHDKEFRNKIADALSTSLSSKDFKYSDIKFDDKTMKKYSNYKMDQILNDKNAFSLWYLFISMDDN